MYSVRSWGVFGAFGMIFRYDLGFVRSGGLVVGCGISGLRVFRYFRYRVLVRCLGVLSFRYTGLFGWGFGDQAIVGFFRRFSMGRFGAQCWRGVA